MSITYPEPREGLLGPEDVRACDVGRAYVAILRKEPASDYSVSFPNFPGCITAGRTQQEAEHFAAEALSLHVSGMLDDGDALPEPRSIEAVMADPEHRDGTPFLVAVSVQSS